MLNQLRNSSLIAWVLVVGVAGCDEGAGGTTTPSATPSAKTTASAMTTSAPSASASAQTATAPDRGDVFFLQPTEGAKVFPEFDVAFGVKSLEIAAAGAPGEQTGYIAVIVDGEPVAEGQDIPKDDKHHVFAKGETFGALELEQGKHTLTIQFVSSAGKSMGPKFSQTISVDVIADEGERSVSFAEPKDGAKVKSPVKMKFEVKGMKIELAGKDPTARTTGHHHVIIDGAPVEVGQPVPDNATHKHFGKGQTEAELELPKGKHKLTLQFADGSHVSYGPKMAQTIEIEVE
jgi:hypothetical protein